ncbi:MAG: hypothetical protein N3J91_05820 [Verrucomicrobiae bacterium]|nr:hypothetical protein [Verrucomicrobiae bacterium]
MKAHVLCFTLLLATGLTGAAADLKVDRYAWEFPVAEDLPAEQTAWLRAELIEQIDDVLKAGFLTPWRVNHADEAVEAYFVYLEPGRIVTTLGWAFPHLPADRQAAARRYVHEHFASARFAPWNPGRLEADVPGTRREFHPLHRVGNWTPGWQAARPTVQSLYGVWLWAWRANDFDAVRPHWGQIKACYEAKLPQTDIFATMNAHLAMIRLAEVFGDAETGRRAWLNLSNHLVMGLGFMGDPAIRTDEQRMSQIERNTARMYGRNNNGGLYWPAQDGSIYRGMMFHGLSPEIGRYLADHVREETLKRHAAGKARLPLWWLLDAPYFQRDYTGDEGVGLVQPEMMGMIFPVERWVVGADAPTLASYLLSAPSCRGDCIWLECLVQALEAHGKTVWRDVRKFRPQ